MSNILLTKPVDHAQEVEQQRVQNLLDVIIAQVEVK